MLIPEVVNRMASHSYNVVSLGHKWFISMAFNNK